MITVNLLATTRSRVYLTGQNTYKIVLKRGKTPNHSKKVSFYKILYAVFLLWTMVIHYQLFKPLSKKG
jgi:hypothetical protein